MVFVPGATYDFQTPASKISPPNNLLASQTARYRRDEVLAEYLNNFQRPDACCRSCYVHFGCRASATPSSLLTHLTSAVLRTPTSYCPGPNFLCYSAALSHALLPSVSSVSELLLYVLHSLAAPQKLTAYSASECPHLRSDNHFRLSQPLSALQVFQIIAAE